MSVIKSLLSGLLGKGEKVELRQSRPRTCHQPIPLSNALRYERGGTVVVFVSGREGDPFNDLSLDLVRPFRERCNNVRVVDLRSADLAQTVSSIAEEGLWFALSFFGGGQNIDIQEGDETVNLWASSGVPFVRVFGDSPAYYPDAHVQTYRNSINFYVHPEHCDFFRHWFLPIGLSLPMHPLLFDVLAEHPAGRGKKIAGKTIVFPKNGNCPEELVGYWRSKLPPFISNAMESLSEEISSPAMIDKPPELADKLIRYFSSKGLDLAPQKRLVFFMTAQLDDYLRRVKCTMIAKSLLDFPVVVRGGNWGHIDFSGRRARFDADSDYSRTRQVIDDCLAIIDMSPNVQNFHDRVLRAAGRYTAFLTNSQRSFSENFENYGVFTFDFNPTSIRECIDQALANPEQTVEMGLRQGDRMRELADENRYADSLLNAVDACALANGDRPEGTQNFVIFPPRRF